MHLPSEKGVNEKGEKVYVRDEMIENLLDDQTFGEKQREADKKRGELTKEEFHRLRALCKRDLFFLCYSVLGYNRLSANLHGHLCTHVKLNEKRRFNEYLLPRGHFKSTILTIGHSIQVVLPYGEEDKIWDFESEKLNWPYTLGTDCRVLIAHETAESAARFLFAITSHFTSNALLMALFPEAIPEKRKHRINKWELELPRVTIGNPEPTIDTLGVGAKSQGRHYNYIKLDDIFGEKARDSNAERETTQDWFDGIQSFFSSFAKDHMDLIGTRYSLDDIYEHAHDRYGEKLVKYCRRVEESIIDTKTGLPFLDREGVAIKAPIFPEEFTPELLDILRKNRKRFSAEYENDPDDGLSGFTGIEKRFFYWSGINEIIVFSGNGERSRINVRDLDIVILVDPGEKSGGFAVTGMDYLGQVFVLVALRIEMKPPDLTEMVFRNVIRWQPRVVGFEAENFASIYQYWWATEMTRRGIRFQVEPVYTKNRSKDDRIMGLAHYLIADKFYINDQQDELLAEWNRVGKSRNVHIFDALAYGPELWRFGFVPGQRDIIDKPIESQIDDRDPETGYSMIKYGDSSNNDEVNHGYGYGT